MKSKNWILSLAAASLVGACAHKKAEEAGPNAAQPTKTPAVVSTEPSQEARYAANENDAAFVSEVIFAKGSSKLSKASKRSLDEMIQKSKKTSALREVKIVAWGDLEYPSVNSKKLPKDQRNLAQARAEALQKVFKKTDVKVELFNMADRPSALSSLMQTDNSRIKKSLEVAGIPNTDTAVKTPSKAGHGIVMVILKD
jgi:outer membrane protein OmpA-like peptidoglycan-associated protein